jgi:uncharacterized Fe-S radical SAM superfamily protein PflX
MWLACWFCQQYDIKYVQINSENKKIYAELADVLGIHFIQQFMNINRDNVQYSVDLLMQLGWPLKEDCSNGNCDT